MTERSPEVLNTIEDLVQKNLFEIHFQPVVAPAERRIVALEALCRFDSEVLAKHQLTVVQVVRLIERMNLYQTFDLAVIDQTLASFQQFRAQTGLELPVSINLCTGTLSARGFVSQLKRRLLKAGVEPARLQLEIRESYAVDQDAYLEVMAKLVAAGIGFAADDFISGQADFGILTSPLVRTIKVNHSVTHSLADSDMARRFLRALLMLVESLNKQLVIKGVESQAQFQFLDAIGCNKYQGYYFARPMAVAELKVFSHDFGRHRDSRIFSKASETDDQESLPRPDRDSRIR